MKLLLQTAIHTDDEVITWTISEMIVDGVIVAQHPDDRELLECLDCRGTGMYHGLFKKEDCKSCNGKGKAQ